MNSPSQPQQSVYGYNHNQHPQQPSTQNQLSYQQNSSHNGYTAIRNSRRQLPDSQQMPMQYTPVQQMHAQQMHAQQMPVQQMHAQQMPVQQMHAQQMPVQQSRKRKPVRVKPSQSYSQATESTSANKYHCEMIAKHIKKCKQCRALYKRNNSLMGVIIILLVIIMYLFTKLVQ